jgi:hypothetical protein
VYFVAVLKTSIIVVFCFFVAFILREFFVYLFIDIRRVTDTHPKPGGYRYDFLSTGTGTDMDTKFYP